MGRISVWYLYVSRGGEVMSYFKTLLTAALLIPTFALADVSGSVGYSSDYMWRGVTQSNGQASLNANLELEKNGFYAGAWVGQVDFGDDASLEKDLYLGYNFSASDNLNIGLGMIQYRWDGGYDMVEEGFVSVAYNNLKVMYFLDTDTENDFARISYDISDFVPVVDVVLGYGYHDENNDFSELKVSYELNDSYELSMLVMLDMAFEDQFSDSVSFGLHYNF